MFAGPSLAGESRAAGVTLLGPAVRGDIAKLVGANPPGAIVLADGKFHQSLSIGHVELRDAIAQRWRVWGVSSIGAIRAFELRHMGMRGFGRVYQMFSRFADFQDDEVALLHGADPPYAAATEPLVHLRFALHALVHRRLLTNQGALALLAELKAMWFGARTLTLFRSLVADACSSTTRKEAGALLADFKRFRIKQQDLAKLLDARPWSVP